MKESEHQPLQEQSKQIFLKVLRNLWQHISQSFQGREERNAGRNVEEQEAKCMGCPPNSEDNKPKSTDDVHNKSHTPPGAEQESKTEQPTEGASNPPERTQQISRAFNAAIRQTLLKIQDFIVFIDLHNGVVAALATITIAVLTWFYVGYAKNQWIVMHAQLEEIRSSSAQTDKMIAIATAQSEASKISAETARQALIASQRAWLGPHDAKLDEAPVAGKKLGVSIAFHNTGREPARNVAWIVDKFIATPEEEAQDIPYRRNLIFLDKCFNLNEREAGQVVYPSTGFTSTILTSQLPEEMIDEDLVIGKKKLIIQGCFVYRTFDKVRHSAFCYFCKTGDIKPEHLGMCEYGNYAD